MNGIIILNGVILILALLFGSIAVWVGVYKTKGSTKPAPQPPPRPVARGEGPTDLWGVERLRRGQRASQ
jgi:hypothetical protein